MKLRMADKTTPYGLTGALSVIIFRRAQAHLPQPFLFTFRFARDRNAIIKGSNMLRHAAGNFYINDKSTGAVVGMFTWDNEFR